MKESKPYRSIAGLSFCSTWFVFLPASFARRILTNEAVSLMTPNAVRLEQRCQVASANFLSASVFIHEVERCGLPSHSTLKEFDR